MGIRATQEVIEVVAQPLTTAVRVSQEVLEVVIEPPSTANLRVTQEVIEVIVNEGEAENPPAAKSGGSGVKCLVLVDERGRPVALVAKRKKSG